MPIQIQVPNLGESVVEATVGRWLKAEGDPVALGEPLVELETDKVNTELSADAGGVLERILTPEGKTVHPGDVLGTIAEGTATEPREPSSGPPASDPREPGSLPRHRSEREGPSGPPASTLNPQLSTLNIAKRSRATPLAERVAEQLKVDLGAVEPDAPGTRVTADDVTSYASGAGDRKGGGAAEPRAASSAPAGPDSSLIPHPSSLRSESRQRLSRRRLTIARRLVEAQQTTAMLTTFNEVDMSAVMDLRQRRREAFEKRHGVRLGYMSFFTKAAVGALKQFPLVNAELQNDELVLKGYYDIGIAIGDKEGLVVPVLRDVDQLTFAEIEAAISGFAEKSKNRSLTLEDLRGGTFTITNGGVYGSLLSTPILNPPQVGILGMHKIQERPVALNAQVVIRPMMNLALSYDHRVVDGREAVQFLVRVKELIEDPGELLLEG